MRSLAHNTTQASAQRNINKITSPFNSSPHFLWGTAPLLLGTSPCNNDFQSNSPAAIKGNIRRSPKPSPPLTGLGIRYPELLTDSKNVVSTAERLPHYLDASPRPFQTFGRNILRTVSIYDYLMDNEPSFEMGLNGLESEPRSPWSFTSILQATELASGDSTLGQMSLCPNINSPHNTSTLNDLFPEDPEYWSIERLSAAAGMTVYALASQISAVADLALQQIASEKKASPRVGLDSEQARDMSVTIETESLNAVLRTPDMAAPIADINMNDLLSSWHFTSACVNPADIMPPDDTQYTVSPMDVPLLTFSKHDSSDEETCHIPLMLEGIVLAPRDLAQTKDKPTLSCDSQPSYIMKIDPESDYETQLLNNPSSPASSPGMDYNPRKRKTCHPRVNKTSFVGKREGSEMETPSRQKTVQQNPNLAINLGTPVFNAHRGIDLVDLKAKAERYRLRNLGEEYDKMWLISFAGKLSSRGELMNEFRCYVNGCHQTNRRRDHILIHVGGHLDQRPFKCLYWYVLGFLLPRIRC